MGIRATSSTARTTGPTTSPAPGPNPTTPRVLAVGDGPSNGVTSNAVAARIASIDPPLFLFLGDVYETGTFTELRNHYGVSALDDPGAGTLWGATANVTQPTVGNHENASTPAFIDYWHQRPLYTKFTFGGVLFLDMDTNISLKLTSKQYKFVQSALITAPPCVVTFWHKPAVKNNTQTIASLQQAWALLANNGVDLLLNGNQHHMVEFKPLDADYNAGTQQAHVVELVRTRGTRLSDDDLHESELILPPPDLTLAEAGAQFSGEGLLPE